jgi:hypothetical protein
MDLPIPSSSSYFITSDAGYCHILPGQVIITKEEDYKEIPVSEDKKSMVTLILGGLGIAFGCFIMVNFFVTGIYPMAVLLLGGLLFATKGLADVARYSAILNISRDKIEEVRVYKPAFGYLFIVIRFRNEQGGYSFRKIKFYDSKQNELHALDLLKKEGLII